MKSLTEQDKKVLLYAPTFYVGDAGVTRRMFFDCWYYRWQKKLWKYLDSLESIKTIWKAHPRPDGVADPFRLWHSDNVEYNTGSLDEQLKKADLVFLDYGFTPLYDAYKANKEILCVAMVGKYELRPDLKDIGVINLTESETKEEDALYLLNNFLFHGFRSPIKININNENWLERVR